ncbi:peptidase inhibitor family I36 protein [Streptomyces sp. URMC 123]|uniref:peptidase inhibitor family I36 protein n=1 Tax=Streptomyces sp. URMC 123 TaxID=3423403 RepID=UPI003F1C01C1
MIRKRAIAVLGSAAGLMLGAVGFAAPAQSAAAPAAPAAPACPANSLCTYSGADLTGTLTVIPATTIVRADQNGVAVPNSAKSAVNRTDFTVRYGPAHEVVCVRYPCYQYGTVGTMAPGARVGTLPATEGQLKVGQDLGN